jgi:carbamoyltransferase
MQTINILSINFNHDGSAVIVSNGKIKAFINTERFSRKKKHPGIRKVDLDNLLQQAGIQLTDVSMVLLCNIHNMDSDDMLTLYGTRLKETWFHFWVNQTLDKVIIEGVELPCIINPEHLLLHAALSFYTSPFDEAICFSWDPTGYAVYEGRKNRMARINYRIRGYNMCHWYNEVAISLFGTGVIGAGKVMGLAPYGDPGEGGRIEYNKLSGLKGLYEQSGNGHAIFVDESEKKLNATLAFNVQHMMESQLCSIVDELYEIARQRAVEPNLCLGGGAALNSVANQVAFQNSKFKNLYIHPASGDDGTPIGAALHYWFHQLNNERVKYANREIMYSVLSYEDSIESALALPQFKDRLIVERSTDYIAKSARYIVDGKIIAWFQDASEIGPRALGNRSILADPRNANMKDILNSRVKFREGFRPFAPSVLNEHAEKWFGLKDSPFMLRVCEVMQSCIPAVTHVDNTARIQTVTEDDNPNFYRLISCFYEYTGVPLLINTSFNIKGESIVETPEDAINCLLNTEIDYLVFNNLIVKKAE